MNPIAPLKVVGRDSPLSKAQVKEVMNLLGLPYEAIFLKSYGDIDKKTSLRALDKTDFFTREVDDLVLSCKADFAIHSAKDLPQYLPDGLSIHAITKGLDSSDVLVLREEDTLDDIKLVATSSVNRAENVKKLKADLSFTDIRGTIHERLEKLYRKEVDGVVIAEAALIRLGLNPNRITLPGTTTPLQGQLAIVARHEANLPFLKNIDCRPKDTLYFGLRCPNPLWHHFPLIKTMPLPFTPIKGATHYIFTSRTAAKQYRPFLENVPIFCTGKETAKELEGFNTLYPEIEQAEEVVDLLKKEDLTDACIVWPKALKTRSVISDFLKSKVRLTEIPLYETITTTGPYPDITPFSKLVFTSPSTVEAFKKIYGDIPADKEVLVKGAVTGAALTGKA